MEAAAQVCTEGGAAEWWGTRTVDAFDKLAVIGAGTYGKVYKARDRVTGEYVALKLCKFDERKVMQNGIPPTTVREIKLLQKLQHPNIVRLKEVVTSSVKKFAESQDHRGNVYLVFEYVDHDLTGLLDLMKEGQLARFTDREVQCLAHQMFSSLQYLHERRIVHRDIKCSNLLVTHWHELKLADFGLSREVSLAPKDYTNNVITLWYRPPELLMGDTRYDFAVDMWSAGCIMAELLVGRPLFPGKNEADQCARIFQTCGSPTGRSWPEYSHMHVPDKPYPNMLRHRLESMADEVGRTIPRDALDLLCRVLNINPRRRATARQVLESSYFRAVPHPHDLPPLQFAAGVLTAAGAHEMQTRERRRAQRKQMAHEQGQEQTEPTRPARSGSFGGDEHGAERATSSPSAGSAHDRDGRAAEAHTGREAEDGESARHKRRLSADAADEADKRHRSR